TRIECPVRCAFVGLARCPLSSLVTTGIIAFLGGAAMKPVVIENPILNSPFAMPGRHFLFDETGITDVVADGRRPSCSFVPLTRPAPPGNAHPFETLWTQDRATCNDAINPMRSRVDGWREQGHPAVTPVTRGLLEYWARPERERRLFFCQIEALETLIYLA